MAEAISEFMYGLLKKMQERFDKVDFALAELKSEVNNLRGTMVAVQGDIHNIYGVLARHDERLDRIERRLELRELAESQKPYDPDA
jgi:tetrahydromethanopterin S-methyltransferase subunit G